MHRPTRHAVALTCTALMAPAAAAQAWLVEPVRLEEALAAPRSDDRPRVIGAAIDPAQYTPGSDPDRCASRDQPR